MCYLGRVKVSLIYFQTYMYLRACVCVCVGAGCLTPRCNVALITAQKSIPNPYVSPCGGVPQLPVAHSTLKKCHTVKQSQWGFIYVHQINSLTLKHCMWKNSPSVSIIIAAPFSSGWEQPEQSRFPLTHLHTTKKYTQKQLATKHQLSSTHKWIGWICIQVLASRPAGRRRLRWRKGRLLFVHYGIVWFWSVVLKHK